MPVLGYLSVAISAIGIVLFIFVKPRQQLQHAGQSREDPAEEGEGDGENVPEAEDEGGEGDGEGEGAAESSRCDHECNTSPPIDTNSSCAPVDTNTISPPGACVPPTMEALESKLVSHHHGVTGGVYGTTGERESDPLVPPSEDGADGHGADGHGDDVDEAIFKNFAALNRSNTTLSNFAPGFVSRTGKATLAETLGARQARFLGVSMALVAGCLYGICMDPAQHMMTRYEKLTADSSIIKYSPFGLDYVFSNNVGAMVVSSFILTTYLVLEKFDMTPSAKYFDPVQHAKLLLPAFAAGAIGSLGSAAWFFANQNLGLVVSFPIIAAGPGVVSSLWGALVFAEVRGLKNYLILAAAFFAVFLAAILSSLGKVGV